LRAHARREGWTVRRFPRRNRVRSLDVVRTLATFGSVLPMIGAALPFRLLGAPDREVINFSVSLWAELATFISGLELTVEHEYRLWTQRPAVFLFNHQSAMDVLITARLLREDMVGVAKREIRRQPLMGPALMSVGTVFIDREAGGDPRAVLQPAVEALEQGRSVVIAPEGTRSRDGRLGPFRKGAFHLAMQAGVPIVPIVIHNAMDALAGSGRVVRPAQVKVTVLDPISTEGWNVRAVVRAARDTRRAYLEVLGPGADGASATP
ncbi:MAG: lysophospholipid acyltransferase family protein, partial [Gammaproteobacteria bacterium]